MRDEREAIGVRDEVEVHTRPHGRDQRIVTIGGGTGPFALLSNLKHYPCSITAIVSMADSGGSSGRLMDEFGQLPFGDLRQALIALSRRALLWREMFGFRFPLGHDNPAQSVTPAGQLSTNGGGEERWSDLPLEAIAAVAQQREVSEHNLGNLIISALEYMNHGDLLGALDDAQDLLETAGRVLPVTLGHATLCAQLTSGDVLYGETTIDTRGLRDGGPLPAIQRIFLRKDVSACEPALHAIRPADVIILGPGDLYTSIVPNLLVRGVSEAIRASEAHTVYVCNLMTKHGETDGFRASEFVREIHRYLGGEVDRVILHNGTFPPHLREHYAAQQQYPVEADVEAVQDLVPEVVVDELLRLQGERLIRHDADRLMQAIFAPLDPDFAIERESRPHRAHNTVA